MTKKNIILAVGTVIFISTLLVLVNWYLVPKPQNTNIWIIIGSSIGNASVFVFSLIGALYALHEINKIRNDKGKDFEYTSQIPENDKLFTGRLSQLQELEVQFNSGKINVFGIHGMGGLGKTSLGIEFANRISKKFDHHIFLDMQGFDADPRTSEEAMYYVVKSLNSSFSFPGDNSFLVGAYRSVVNKNRVLIFLDNVKDEAQIQSLIPPKRNILIFTSRTKFSLPRCISIDLPLMPELEARELLFKITDGPTTDEADQIVGLCGYLPSAIMKSGKSLREYSNIGVRNYINTLSQIKNKSNLVEATTSLSYNLLPEQLKMAWRRLSIFTKDFGLEAASRVLECDVYRCEKLIFELVRLSLINPYFSPPSIKSKLDLAEQRFILHDLDQEYARTKLKEDERRSAELILADYYAFVLGKLEMLYKKGGDNLIIAIVAFDREWVNIKHAQNISARYAKINERAARTCIQLCLNSASLIDIRLSKKVIINWSETGLRIARRLRDTQSEGVALNNIGNAYSDIGEFDQAIPYLEKAMEIARADKNLYLEQGRLGGLGNVYRRKGDFEKSLDFHKKSLEIAIKLKDRYEQANNLFNVGNVYRDMKNINKAIEYHERSLKIAKEEKFKVIEAYALGGLGADYQVKMSLLKMYKCDRLALALAREMKLSFIEAIVIRNYGLFFETIGLGIIAKMYYRKSDDLGMGSGSYLFMNKD